MRTLLLSLLICVTAASSTADAKLFGRRRASHGNSACPDGVCPRPGQLAVNDKGGFEGQLPDSYYQSAIVAPVVATNVAPVVPAVAQTSIPVASKPETSLLAAVRSLNDAKAALAAAEKIVARALADEAFEDRIAAAKLEAELQILSITKDREISELRSKIQALNHVVPTLAPVPGSN